MSILCILLTASLILITCACRLKSHPPVTACEVLEAMLKVSEKPQGIIRVLTDDGNTENLPKDLLTALYGPTAGKWYKNGEASLIDDGAVYLSEVLHPFELAVFRCMDEKDVTGGMASVLGVCSARLELIRNTWQGSEHESFIQDATVTYCDGFVLLIVAEHPEVLIKAAEKVIKTR